MDELDELFFSKEELEKEIEEDKKVEVDENQVDLDNLVIDYMNNKEKYTNELIYQVSIHITYKHNKINVKGILNLCKIYHNYFRTHIPRKLKTLSIQAEQFDREYIYLLCFECIDKYYNNKYRYKFSFLSYFYSTIKHRFINIFNKQKNKYYDGITSFCSIDKVDSNISNEIYYDDTYFQDELNNEVKLTEKEKNIINLLLQDKKKNEISSILKINEKNLYRSIIKIKEKLANHKLDDITNEFVNEKIAYNQPINETNVNSDMYIQTENVENERKALILKNTRAGYNTQLKDILKKFDEEHGVKFTQMTKIQMYNSKDRDILLTKQQQKSIQHNLHKKEKNILTLQSSPYTY